MTPVVAGVYSLAVTMNSIQIAGSPFTVTVNCAFLDWTIPTSVTNIELTVPETVTVAVTAKDNSYNFCSISLSTSDPQLISFSGLDMTVGTIDMALNAATHTVTVTATFDN